jgi:glutathione S-transferase
MNTLDKNKPLLITIAISHYCEKVRWAMDSLGIDYIEENHAPPFHRQYTSHYGGTSVPVLFSDGKAFTDSQDILHYLDTIVPNQLYAQDSQLRQQAETLEALFDDKLGVATRNCAYYYAIQQPWSILAAWSKGISLMEKVKCAIAFPVSTKIIKQKYNLTLEGKEAAVQDIREVFDIVNQKVNLGQKYLLGDRFSATEITFAALASPIIRPEHHPVYDSQLAKLPTEMVALVEELRATPAGELVMRMYREHRH